MNREQRLSEVFVELADTLVDEFEALDLMHTLAERSIELLHADAAGLILSDHQGQLKVVASTSHQARVVEAFVVQNAEGPCLECFTTGHPVVNVDLDEVHERWPNFQRAAVAAGYRSTHALPLRLRSETIGAMSLFCADRLTLSDDDISLGQALADVATIGLLQERAARHQEILTEQLQSALNSRVLIEQAKGVLSERAGISVGEAFMRMRDHSRRNHEPLRTVALGVINGSHELGQDSTR